MSEWISVDDGLPEKRNSDVWSIHVTVWYKDIDTCEENFKESCMYNYGTKSWEGVNGLSGNYDNKYKALFWTHEKIADIVEKSLPEQPKPTVKPLGDR